MKNSELNPKIIFWGTAEFALPSLYALIKNKFNIVAVIANPDEPTGRKQIITPPPVKIWADKHKIPCFQPHNLKEGFVNELPEADLYIVASYGKIIPKEIIEIPRFGAINIHPSLLPRWRGPSPIQSAILAGDLETGLTIIKLDELMDHGPIIAVSGFPLKAHNKITYNELHDNLAKLGADLLVKTLPQWINGTIEPIPQDDTKAAYSTMLKKDSGRINWEKPADEIERMIRAFNPWPSTWTIWPTGDKIYRIKIESADISEDEPARGSYGYIWQPDSKSLFIKTGKGSLSVKKITLQGKKSTNALSFLNGYPQILGSTLI